MLGATFDTSEGSAQLLGATFDGFERLSHGYQPLLRGETSRLGPLSAGGEGERASSAPLSASGEGLGVRFLLSEAKVTLRP